MVANYESDKPAKEPLLDADERRFNAMVDGSGFPVHSADAAMSGYDEDRFPPHLLRDLPTKKSRASRRGGRSFPEASYSELDPNWIVEREELSPEQLDSNAQGAGLARQIARAGRIRRTALYDPTDLSNVLAVQKAEDNNRKQ